MPTYKISQLTTATAVSATNQFEINQNGTSKSVEVSVIDAYIKSTSNLPVVVSVSSATNALRITQTGTGNALVVEDSTNPDATPLIVNAAGQLLLGTTTNVAATTKLQIATLGNDFDAPALEFTKERAGTAVRNNQVMGITRYWGYDGASYLHGGSIESTVEATPSVGVMPTSFTFRTRTVGGADVAERLLINGGGGVYLCTSSGDGQALSTTVPAKLRLGSGQYTDNSTAASGTVSFGTLNSILGAPVAALNTGVTYTSLATLYISAAPTAGTNVTITNPYSFYVAAGTSYFGGQLQTAAGTAAAPAISTIGDTNNGIFFPAADTTAFSTAGTERIRIDSGGRLLIGTTTNVFSTTTMQLTNKALSSVPSVFDFTKDRNGGTILDGDGLGWIRWWGLDASATPTFRQAGSIEVTAEGAPGANLMPSTMTFKVRSETNTSFGDIRLQLLPWGQMHVAGTINQGPALSTTNPSKIRVPGATYTDSTTAASGTVSHGITFTLGASNIAALNTGVTYTNASTLYINAAPAAGTNVTITNAYAIYIAAGASFFGGQVQGPAGTAAAPSFSTTGDTNTGMFFPAADTLAISTAGAERMRITSTGNVVAGGSAALATTATDGFLYVPTCAGTPTGTPTTITGMAPIVINTTNNKLYFYSGGAWRDAGP